MAHPASGSDRVFVCEVCFGSQNLSDTGYVGVGDAARVCGSAQSHNMRRIRGKNNSIYAFWLGE